MPVGSDELRELIAVRVRFVGSQMAIHYPLSLPEWTRLHTDWESYLRGSSVHGGEYCLEASPTPGTVSLNFSVIACIEWDAPSN